MKRFKKITAVLLAALLVCAALPFSAFAAPKGDIPKAMLDNVYLDALAYTGYNVQGQKNDGSIFVKYGSTATAYNTKIGYGAGSSGLEVKNGKPDIDKFRTGGLCCASYVAYVLFNYLPNVAGTDLTKAGLDKPKNTRSQISFFDKVKEWKSKGLVEEIGFTQNNDGSNFKPAKEPAIGSIVFFYAKGGSKDTTKHIALYAGSYDGKHFITHVGNSRGPEIAVIETFTKSNMPELVSYVFEPIVKDGAIEIHKTDGHGHNLAGAKFLITNTQTQKKVELGPTDSNGYAKVDKLEYGTYTVTETKAPDHYTMNFQTQTVTLNDQTPNHVFRIEATNTRKGYLKIHKTDGGGVNLAGAEFDVIKDGQTKGHLITKENGDTDLLELDPGVYTVKETKVPDNFVTKPGEPVEWTVNVKSAANTPPGQAAPTDAADITLHTVKNYEKPDLKIVKKSEDGKVAGIEFTVTGDNFNETVTTDGNGEWTLEHLKPGVYTVTEAESDIYVPNDPQTVELKAKETKDDPPAAVTFNNTLMRGNLTLTKTSEDGMVEGIQFHLYGTSKSGEYVSMFAKTDETGVVRFENVLIGDDYILEEDGVPAWYIVPDPQHVSITYDAKEKKPGETEAEFENEILYGNIIGYKTDRETKEPIEGAWFGLFNRDETEFTFESALKTARSDTDGIFRFDAVKYGEYWVRELRPADGYLPNTDIYPVTVDRHLGIFEIQVQNDRIPELATHAETPDGKVTNPLKDVTVTDIVHYEHLIPGKEYTVKGTLMNKATGEPFLVNGEPVTAETVFTPESPSGDVTVTFTFDATGISETTGLVAFEELYRDDLLLAVHADIDDEDQTVTVEKPEIGTEATVNGAKKAATGKTTEIKDTVRYGGLIPGKTYVLKAVLIDKATGETWKPDGKERYAERTFTPETPEGEVDVTFTLDTSGVGAETDLVVYETLYRDGVELAAHADIDDAGQTVTITPPPVPQTGDRNGGRPFAAAVVFMFSLAALAVTVISGYKRRKADKN